MYVNASGYIADELKKELVELEKRHAAHIRRRAMEEVHTLRVIYEELEIIRAGIRLERERKKGAFERLAPVEERITQLLEYMEVAARRRL